MVAGPGIAALIEDIEYADQLMGRRNEVLNHDQTASVQNAFRKDVCLLVNVREELGNPFEEESEDNTDIANPSAVEAVKKAQKIGQQQFQTFTNVLWREQSIWRHNSTQSVETVCWLNDKDGK